MKVLGISGSMRRDGNTARLVNIILDRCRSAGIETEFVSLSGLEIKPCTGCEKCKESKECAVEDDDWHDIIEKVIDCEVLVIGSPTYYYDINGHLKNFIDRTYSLFHNRLLAGRKAAIVAVHATTGGARALQTLEGFLNAHEFSYVGSVVGQGYLPGEVMNDHPAVAEAEAIGNKIVKLLHH
ncbi:MAG: flavodoxin family protein [Methanoregulaceae archaeon]|nr:flavodoxin family protein [Methanoregulaceae archaeon]